jgi:hypothetical protein
MPAQRASGEDARGAETGHSFVFFPICAEFEMHRAAGSFGGIARAEFLGNAIVTGVMTNSRSRMISAPRGMALVAMQPLPFPGTSTTRTRHPPDEPTAGYGPLESNLSRLWYGDAGGRGLVWLCAI